MRRGKWNFTSLKRKMKEYRFIIFSTSCIFLCIILVMLKWQWDNVYRIINLLVDVEKKINNVSNIRWWNRYLFSVTVASCLTQREIWRDKRTRRKQKKKKFIIGSINCLKKPVKFPIQLQQKHNSVFYMHNVKFWTNEQAKITNIKLR